MAGVSAYCPMCPVTCTGAPGALSARGATGTPGARGASGPRGSLGALGHLAYLMRLAQLARVAHLASVATPRACIGSQSLSIGWRRLPSLSLGCYLCRGRAGGSERDCFWRSCREFELTLPSSPSPCIPAWTWTLMRPPTGPAGVSPSYRSPSLSSRILWAL